MQYKLGNFKTIHQEGETPLLTCPNCNEKVNFTIFKNNKAELTSNLPLVKTDKVYFLICPKCASVYGMDSNKIDSLLKGNELSVGNYDFKKLDIFNDKT